jgi:hypothetical protein
VVKVAPKVAAWIAAGAPVTIGAMGRWTGWTSMAGATVKGIVARASCAGRAMTAEVRAAAVNAISVTAIGWTAARGTTVVMAPDLMAARHGGLIVKAVATTG